MVQRTSTHHDWSEIASAAREHIAQHAERSDLRIDAVAHALAVSRRKLQRVLAWSGTDYSRELHIRRMEIAARNLSREASVSVARSRSGYRSDAHFTRTFHGYYGITPDTYRRVVRLQALLDWRDWNDKVRRVPGGTREYYRRRKRRNENVRELHRLTRGLLPNARRALAATARAPRPVLDLEAMRRATAARWRDRWHDERDRYDDVILDEYEDYRSGVFETLAG
jgi:AraC-like DNA-binding protein